MSNLISFSDSVCQFQGFIALGLTVCACASLFMRRKPDKFGRLYPDLPHIYFSGAFAMWSLYAIFQYGVTNFWVWQVGFYLFAFICFGLFGRACYWWWQRAQVGVRPVSYKILRKLEER